DQHRYSGLEQGSGQRQIVQNNRFASRAGAQMQGPADRPATVGGRLTFLEIRNHLHQNCLLQTAVRRKWLRKGNRYAQRWPNRCLSSATSHWSLRLNGKSAWSAAKVLRPRARLRPSISA